MKLEKLTPGMIVFDVGSHRMGNTALRTVAVWKVKIVSVDLEKRTVMASRNFNAPMRFYEQSWRKWQLKEPLLIKGSFGQQRLATRAEIKARNTP